MSKKILLPIVFVGALAFTLGWLFSSCPREVSAEKHKRFIREIPLGNGK